MAEGVSVIIYNANYFCYICNREVCLVDATELICPECSGGFLEEVADAGCGSEPEHEDSDIERDEMSLLNLMNLDRLFNPTVINTLSEIDRSDNSDESDYSEEPDGRRDEPADDRVGHSHVSMASILQEIQIHMANADDRLRHIGDYWYQDEIDALSTMLLNDTDTFGPPPLPKDKIKLLPTVTVSNKLIEKDVQCTVCMENFHLREKAKQLPCEHLFHEKCINQWLEMHATCPNCREKVEIPEPKIRRSQSCPRTETNSAVEQAEPIISNISELRRLSESVSSLRDYFSNSMSQFRFL